MVDSFEIIVEHFFKKYYITVAFGVIAGINNIV